MKRRTFLGGALTVFSGLGAAACSTVPGNSTPTIVGTVPSTANAVAVQPPADGAQPDEIVRGFIQSIGSNVPEVSAGTSATTNFTAARQYLTPQADDDWAPNGRTPMMVLRADFRVAPGQETNVYVITGTLIASLDETRSYTVPADDTFSTEVTVARVNGQWRIATPPDVLLITTANFGLNYIQRTLYFLDPTGSVMVPDPRYIPVAGSAVYRAARVLSLLLAGPGPALQGVVRNELEGAELRRNFVPEQGALPQVDLTNVKTLETGDRKALAAQIAYSLSADAATVPVLINGELLEPGVDSYSRRGLGSYDPDSTPGSGTINSEPYCIRSGRVESLLTRKPLDGPAGNGVLEVLYASLSTVTGTLAVVTGTLDKLDQQQLRLGDPLSPVTVLEAEKMTPPVFSRTGDEVWVAQTTPGSNKQEIYAVSVPTGSGAGAGRTRISTPDLDGKGTVTAIALSPDRVRVALVIDGRLFLGAVQNSIGDAGAGTTTTVVNAVEIRPGISQVNTLAFRSSVELLVSISESTSTGSIVRVPLDGSEQAAVTSSGLVQDVDTIAVSGDDVYVSSNTLQRIVVLEGTLDAGTWEQPVNSGGFPITGGEQPFFPN
ncbi:hypothetical protein GIS00_03295 [Nakamurella sp. YIM 132087]|uniref:GerMN domain-containing protein n=1 Tax=Nakamurella alba TaxID=2665158 RepID=A0A7K1FFX6_9ACTN|nr:LpqB family beta-propeller domain-containing protein [Nakamurella alba]MTD12970.1 hypothetical protein [Nakamurella alba]